MSRVVALLVVLAAPRAALPCSLPICESARILGISGEIPANAWALPFQPTQHHAPDSPFFQNVATLLDADGATVATQVDADPRDSFVRIVRPLEGFTAGTSYRLQITDDCAFGTEPDPILREAVFVTGPNAEFPKSVGKVAVAANDTVENAFTSSGGGCGGFVRKGVRVHLKITLDPAMLPWARVTSLRLDIGANRWAGRQYGAWTNDELLAADPRSSVARDVNVLFRACDTADNPTSDTGLTAGTHTARLSAHVAGAAVDPAPAEVSFSIACPGEELAKPPLGGGTGKDPVEEGCHTSVVGSAALALVAARRRRWCA